MVLLSLLLAASPSPSTALSIPPALQRVLDGGTFANTPAGFRAITLSHVADGCRWQADADPSKREAAHQCVEAAYARSLDLLAKACPSTARGRDCDAKTLLSSVDPLALEHLLLVMGDADATGTCLDEALHLDLARGLAEASVADPYGIVPSYRSFTLRWPADQSALLAGLSRADAAHGTSFATEPTAKLLAVIDSNGLHSSGLPKSELTGKGPGAKFPRGCAQSFISRYLSEVEPTRTSAWWATYKKRFFVELPFEVVGFREWPPGVDGQVDSDSGPIILGIGTAASALAISAAKAQGDARLAHRLEKSAATVEGLGVGAAMAHASFAEAIRFEGRWHPMAAAPAD